MVGTMNEKPFKLYSLFLVVLIVLAIALPFADKAFHIDDTFVLGITKNILENPADPFKGDFDWHGYMHPIWQTTTNPPLVSYYLAPFVAKYGYSEVALHVAMMFFLLLLGWGTVMLSHRFAGGSNIPLFFVMFSPAVMLSGNVMRDIPAVGLAVAGIALFIMGTDRQNRFLLLLGSLLAGLAVLAKYSAITVLPILILYPLFKRKIKPIFWLIPGALLFGAWCLHNIVLYDQMHITFLMGNRHILSGIPWQHKAFGVLVIFGSMIYLLPVLMFGELARKRWIAFSGCLPIGILAFWGVQSRFGWNADVQYLIWAVTGALLLYLCMFEALRRGLRFLRDWKNEDASDSLFLFAWLCAPVLFSIIFVPFQAVRHQLLALVPLMLLGWRALYKAREKRRAFITSCVVILFFLQATVSYMVTTSDYQLADTYRMMASYAKQKFDTNKTWFVGHWGWQYYAEEAGFKMRHRDDELPKPGDVVLWPMRVHCGEVWDDLKGDNAFKILSPRTIDKVTYKTDIPIRTMNFQGAAFYAVIGDNVPYCYDKKIPLEMLKVYQVRDYKADDVLKKIEGDEEE